ncbi:MAG: lipid-A-disaccharide synthase-related protein [Elainellaceae cyanobacterium]
MKLLCLSNGHGEDAIALRVLKALQQKSQDLKQPLELAALPIVGDGYAYQAADIPLAGPTQVMPSGGFVYMDGAQLWRDVRGGLLTLTRAQIQVARRWGRAGGSILAVGDIVPLLFAWASGASYAFIGTAKSEYYLRDESGPLAHRAWFDQIEGWTGSVYLPWERWLMSRPRCRSVFPRDRLTAEFLKQWPIPAVDLGNPMMDGLRVEPDYADSLANAPPQSILLLPGSRSPEAERNWQMLLAAADSVRQIWGSARFLAAISPNLDQAIFDRQAVQQGWRPAGRAQSSGQTYTSGEAALDIDARFYDFLHQADAAIAMAGTATEQFVGLGKPVIALPGEGPQFTPAFAEAQTRLLGPSAQLVTAPAEAGKALQRLWADVPRRQAIARSGQRRLGPPGAAERIAAHLLSVMASPSPP